MLHKFEKVAEGIPGVEGPVFDQTGRFFVVEPFAGKILQILDGGATQEHANTGGIPAGLAVDALDNLWVADMKLGILRVTPAGAVEHIVGEFQHQPIRGCNDLCLDRDENIYFTAPAGSDAQTPVGEVFCRLMDGEIRRIDQGFAFCNGIALAPGGDTLIVAETLTKILWAYEVTVPGHVTNKRHWATVPGDHHGGPDGIDFDVDGNLLAANWGGGAIEVFDSRGQHIERIITPFSKPSNLHFGGRDGCDLWITEHSNNTVWKCRWHTRGLLALKQR